ncbi:DEAD/DEAH box helicase-like protein [Westerdykella ornata]|uniref:DEAD/DEAH box helicase-like protein n=1 Tax=Westerdykella ornata TaxID=318751 RepID=A0A6A6J4G3_WESOR|nr:DEAD/DEAH box helicase-like protein [Westerdykella ornata]KAF2271282.1 DEAD/DEAH box helicase-like protein [Westerdykella ornata]
MARLKAGTVSDQVVRKRRRTAATTKDGEDGIAATRNENDVPPSKKPALSRQDSSAVIEPFEPWPEHFKKLAQAQRALSLVYTFCCTRKHVATTFDNIKFAVEAHIRRELHVSDVVQIAVLMPRSVRFHYVDEAMLQANLMTTVEELGARDPADHKSVLLFEFLDGDLKRGAQPAKNGQGKPAPQRLRNQNLKMPVFTQKQLTNLIEKRNGKFVGAVNGFLHQCAAEGVDPVGRIEGMAREAMPVPPEDDGLSADRAMLPLSIPDERKSIPEIIEEIKTLEWYTGQIVPDGHRVFDPQPAIYGELKFQLSQNLVNALYNTRNITQLYSHQAEAINHLHDGHNVIVSTSTSSGKSLIYQIPVLHQLERESSTRAMYIFPTKALAQDQRRSLKEMLRFMDGLQDIVVETFDGDTPMAERNHIRDEARIIFTNPDMLHITILPQEEAWRSFLQNLRFVVVDELHVYNGLFGSHVSLIMRRLRRICAAVGNTDIKFISCSATVANPEAHMKTIFGIEDVKLIDFDGSPSGRKEFLCWNTPFKDPGDPTSGRGDSVAECAKLFCQLILRGVRAIAFCRVRKQCEALLAAIKAELTNLERPEVIARVMGYRGGYTSQDRRRIEQEMFQGKLVGIVATSALELGVDIGSLDAVVTCGFPYTIANLRQQSGRAGRRNKDSLSVLVGDCFPTDQYYMSNPDEIFTKPNCELQVDLENILVLEGHVQCAAHEMPIDPEADMVYFGPLLPKIAKERMRRDDAGFYHTNERFLPYPSRHIAIRDTEDSHFAIIDVTHGRNMVLEELEASRAFFTIYEGGIFLHQGRTYLVREFSQDRMLAKVEHVSVDWTTLQRDYTDIDPVETEAIRRIPGSRCKAYYGPIQIQQVVFGFFKVDKRRRIIDAVEVDNPPIILRSKGMWLDVPTSALELLKSRRLNIAAAIHAAEHAVLSLLPNFVISMPGDVRTECKVALKEFAAKETARKRPARLTFYDAKGGASGSGISTKAFEFCCCDERCKEANQVMSKAGALVVVMSLLGREAEIDVDSLPWGEDEAAPAGVETVVPAQEVIMARGVEKDGVWIKEEDAEENAFARSIRVFGGEGRLIGVHS